MIYLLLFVLGLCLGSFINAFVWRLGQQLDKNGDPKKLSKKQLEELSIVKGRSMCTECKHALAWYDLLPVVSWVTLGGKCRYCKKKVSAQYPVVELLTALLFLLSYYVWPLDLGVTWVAVAFIAWLIVLVGLIALALYDIKHMLLPNRIIYPLIYIVTASLVVQFALGRPPHDIWAILSGCVVSAGIFWVLYQLSGGSWIGGGDIKLGLLAGLLLGSATGAFLFLFISSLLGLVCIAPLMALGKLSRTSRVPFGPFLIAALIIVMLWGLNFTNWYTNTFIGM